ncbi:hypothetical protein [Halorarum halobium]|uniref:hypothetical protein n=1 Tax=Halorarum halobium TaxID=3075121 RepID=UPI0028A72BD9|nr:hypothetical protein [Halobaculum sp. XH14]
MAGREDLDNFQVYVTVALYFIAVVTVVLSIGYRVPAGGVAGFSLMISSYLYERVSIFIEQVDEGGA